MELLPHQRHVRASPAPPPPPPPNALQDPPPTLSLLAAGGHEADTEVVRFGGGRGYGQTSWALRYIGLRSRVLSISIAPRGNHRRKETMTEYDHASRLVVLGVERGRRGTAGPRPAREVPARTTARAGGGYSGRSIRYSDAHPTWRNGKRRIDIISDMKPTCGHQVGGTKRPNPRPQRAGDDEGMSCCQMRPNICWRYSYSTVLIVTLSYSYSYSTRTAVCTVRTATHQSSHTPTVRYSYCSYEYDPHICRTAGTVPYGTPGYSTGTPVCCVTVRAAMRPYLYPAVILCSALPRVVRAVQFVIGLFRTSLIDTLLRYEYGTRGFFLYCFFVRFRFT